MQLSLPDLPGTGPAPAGVPSLEPIYLGPAAVTSRSYGVDAAAVTVHVAYYRQQGYGHKLVSSENMLVKSDDRRWNHSASGRVEIAVGERVQALRTAELLGGALLGTANRQRLDVRQVYWVDGRLSVSDAQATVLGVVGRLSGRGDDGAVITFYTAGAAGEGTAARLDGFVRAQLPAITAYLASVRAAR